MDKVVAVLALSLWSSEACTMQVVSTLDGPPGSSSFESMVLSGSYAFSISSYGTMYFVSYDISSPTSPSLAGSLELYGKPTSMAADGSYAFVTVEPNGLMVIDISAPSNPTVAGNITDPTFTTPTAVAVNGNYAYIASWEGWLVPVDITSPTSPQVGTSLKNQSGGMMRNPVALAVTDGLAFLASISEQNVAVVNLSNPMAPVWTGPYTDGTIRNGNTWWGMPVEVPTRSMPKSVTVRGDYLFIGYYAEDAGLVVMNISTPDSPVPSGDAKKDQTFGLNMVQSMALHNDIAYVVASQWVVAVDISDPSPGATLNVTGALNSWDSNAYPNPSQLHAARGSATDGQYLYVATAPGLSVVEVVSCGGGTITTAESTESTTTGPGTTGTMTLDNSNTGTTNGGTDNTGTTNQDTTPEGDSGPDGGIIAVVVVGGLFVICLCVGGVVCMRRRGEEDPPADASPELESPPPTQEHATEGPQPEPQPAEELFTI